MLFGRPGWLRPKPSTLVYAWTSKRTPTGSVVHSPRHPGDVRTLVLRSGNKNVGRWMTERRNLIEDYRRAFGTDPPEKVEAVAIWSDGDQTDAVVRAYYGSATATPQ